MAKCQTWRIDFTCISRQERTHDIKYECMSIYSSKKLISKNRSKISDLPLCEENVIHAKEVKQARQSLLDDDTSIQLARFFQALADPTRLRLISALTATDLCVCDLAAALGMSQSAISHQLRSLRDLRLVKSRKAGRIVYYSLDDEHIRTLYSLGLSHHEHHS